MKGVNNKGNQKKLYCSLVESQHLCNTLTELHVMYMSTLCNALTKKWMYST